MTTNFEEALTVIDGTTNSKCFMYHIQYNEHISALIKEITTKALQSGESGIHELRELEVDVIKVVDQVHELIGEKRTRQIKLAYIKDTEYILDNYIVDYIDTASTYLELIRENENYRSYLMGKIQRKEGFATEVLFPEIITHAFNNNLQEHEFMQYVHDISILTNMYYKDKFTVKLRANATRILDWIEDTFQPILSDASTEVLWALRVILDFITKHENRCNSHISESKAQPQPDEVIEMIMKLKQVYALNRSRSYAVGAEEILLDAAQDIEEYNRMGERKGVNRYAAKNYL